MEKNLISSIVCLFQGVSFDSDKEVYDRQFAKWMIKENVRS